MQSLETLCARWNIREDVAGASFVAFGSAAPEIIINSITTLKSAASADKGADLGVAAIIGKCTAMKFTPQRSLNAWQRNSTPHAVSPGLKLVTQALGLTIHSLRAMTHR